MYENYTPSGRDRFKNELAVAQEATKQFGIFLRDVQATFLNASLSKFYKKLWKKDYPWDRLSKNIHILMKFPSKYTFFLSFRKILISLGKLETCLFPRN